MIRRSIFLFMAIFLWCLGGFTQPYSLGLNPATQKWYRIDTDEARIIFPIEAEEQGQRVANLVHFMADSSYHSLGDRRKKVSIILHNRSLTPNGFVTVSPFRSELYTNGPMFNVTGGSDWLDLLTIHEYRHIEQFSNTNKGITKVLSWLYGQNGWGGGSVVALPRWFFEGDAVFYETTLTNSGRGRMPYFENQYKALLLSNRKLGYEKAGATSLKEFIPSHYSLGYYLTTSLRRHSGENVWQEIISDAVKYKGIFFPLSRSIKKKTGMSTSRFFRSTMDELQSEWENDISGKWITPARRISEDKKAYTNYYNAKFLSPGSIVVEKQGFRDIPTFYLIDPGSGESKKIIEPGLYARGNATISGNDRWIVWSEYSYDPRWGNQEFSVIMAYDQKARIRRLITQKTRYLAPSISPDGERIAAINYNVDGSHEIHVLSFPESEVLHRFTAPDDSKFTFPTWIDNKTLGMIIKKDSRNAIGTVNLETSDWKILTPFWDQQISYLTYNNDTFYFTGIFGGTDNIFSWTKDGDLMQVTSTKFGAIQPDVSWDGRTLIFSEYTVDGYDLMIMDNNPSGWKKVENVNRTTLDYFEPVANTLNPVGDLENKEYPTSRYKELSGFVLHSWAPWASPGNFNKPLANPPNYGFLLFADNPLSTVTGIGSFNYNSNEKSSSYGVDIQYGKFYPVFEAGFKRSDRNRYVPVHAEETVDNEIIASLAFFSQDWKQNKLSLGATLPLNLTFGNMYSRLWLSGIYSNLWVEYDNVRLGTDESFGTLDFELDFDIFKRRAIQHVKPRYGLLFNLQYKTTMQTIENDSYYFQTSSTLFLPGIFKTHSFFISGYYKSEPFVSQFKFEDNFFYARGYSNVPNPASFSDQVNKIAFNYQLPLLYPDLPIGPFVFLQRVKSNFFFDHSNYSIDSHNIDELTTLTRPDLRGRWPANEGTLESAGVEILFDFRAFRLTDVSMGFRYSRLLSDNIKDKSHFDFIIVSLGIPQ